MVNDFLEFGVSYKKVLFKFVFLREFRVLGEGSNVFLGDIRKVGRW